MSDIALFFVALGFGGALGILYLPLSLLRKSGGTVGTVIIDVATAALLFAPLVLLAFLYTDGAIAPYTVIGLAVGFFAFKIPVTALFRRIKIKWGKKCGKKVDESRKSEV